MRAGRHAKGHQRHLEVVVWDEARRKLDARDVSRVGETLLALRIVTVADEVITPGYELSRRVDTSLEEVEATRTIVVVAHVVFTRPQHLHRYADLFGDRRSLAHVVVRETTTESATCSLNVDRDVRL